MNIEIRSEFVRKQYDDIADRLRLVTGVAKALTKDTVFRNLQPGEVDIGRFSKFLSRMFEDDEKILLSEHEAWSLDQCLLKRRISKATEKRSVLQKIIPDLRPLYCVESRPLYIDLFCGSGGLAEGFHQGGFTLAFAADFDETALRTFRLNIPHREGTVQSLDLIEGWREVVDAVKEQNIDVICGGPPCQGFSVIGRSKRGTLEERRKGFVDDPRNSLFRSFVKVVDELQPKAFLMENVAAVKSAHDYEEVIAASFKKCGYRVESCILNASDFGIPQDRSRIFFLGFRKDLGLLPRAVFDQIYLRTKDVAHFYLGDALQSLPEITPISTKGQPYLEEPRHGCTVLPRSRQRSTVFERFVGGDNDLFIYNHKSRYNNDRDLEIFATLKPGEDSNAVSISHLMPYRTDVFSDKYYRLHPDRKSKTILAHMKFDANSYIHPTQARTLTPREAARIQTYPDDFVFLGSLSKQFQQIGNSVPCKMAEVIAETIRQVLDTRPAINKNVKSHSSKLAKRPIALATVFSGIGAVEWALKRLDWDYEIVFASDNDRFVKETYFANYDIDETRWHEDVRNIDGRNYRGKVDLFVGGSPCQSFSFVGGKAGLEDTRGTLFYDFARLVREIAPKVFIYENVKGLLDHDQGRTWKVMRDVFHELNYEIHQTTLNAKNYGMPQHRERLFVVGFSPGHGEEFQFPEPIPLKWRMTDFLQDSFELSNAEDSEELFSIQRTENDLRMIREFRQEQHNINDPYFDKYVLSDKVRRYVMASGTKNFYSKPKVDLDIARPLLATMHKMHRAGVDNYMTCRDDKLRKLTPRECLRLMGFDDEFKIVVSNVQAYRQAGNSIVVDVLMHLLQAIGM